MSKVKAEYCYLPRGIVKEKSFPVVNCDHWEYVKDDPDGYYGRCSLLNEPIDDQIAICGEGDFKVTILGIDIAEYFSNLDGENEIKWFLSPLDGEE